MLGETVTVLTRTLTGTDAMGEPTYSWGGEEVANVLVRPLSGSDLADADRPDGVRAQYSLAFPRSWADGKPPGYLAHARVALTDRGMDANDADRALRVSGSPDRTPESPLLWDLSCDVGRVDG